MLYLQGRALNTLIDTKLVESVHAIGECRNGTGHPGEPWNMLSDVSEAVRKS